MPVLSLLLAVALVSPAMAGIPLEVGLFKSTLLKLNKKMVLVTLANTRKSDQEKDADIVAKSDKIDLERRRSQDSGPSNTNKFVTLDVLSPYDLKLDGIMIGNTSMIIWTKDDKDEKPVATFYDVKVTGDRSAIEAQLKEMAPNDAINVQFANDTVILTGSVANDQTRLKAENTAKAFATKVLNHIVIDNPQQVLLQVKVAQMDKTALKNMGVSFMIKGSKGEGFSNLIGAPSGSASSGSSSSSSSGGISGTASGLGSFNPLDAYQIGAAYFPGGVGAVLQALATKGYAKILAEPNMLVKSGQEGNFLAGSKIPYSVLLSSGGTTTTTIVFQDVGVKLKFKPEVLENGLISLKLDPAEVSSLSGTLAVNGYPIIDTRTLQTSVELKDGESLVLAGLLQEEAIKTMSKIPLLGDIPILGALFRSTQDSTTEKELVFFITPKIVKPLAPGVRPELPTDRKLTPEQERELKWMPLGE
ncbi:type II and III secretion system protein family protein [Oryzomonas japonica]|uniref:type II and III secretion system protein family protein n=1 Tax=Oryzomonas japonica TaxID=2603858 RepID=UPI001FE940CD|nr:BON domain-containing protein [Oryzomonas japonica]